MKARRGWVRHACAAGLAAVSGAYALTIWRSPWIGSDRAQWWVTLSRGTVGFSAERRWPRGGVSAGMPRREGPFIWWFDAGGVAGTGGGWAYLTVPLWVPGVLAGAGWALARVRDRKRSAGLCARCGYARAGLAAGAPCPECGG
jgi:hypothetical protein